MEIEVEDAKSQFSRLIDRVAAGEQIVITRNGEPTARLVPLEAQSKTRRLGSAKGEFTVPDDFNDPLPKEIEDLFYGE